VLTIKAFSQITAIPESTLRYYEQEGILVPAARAANGYRLYAPEQIVPAKFVYSLRLAQVPIGQVRAYQGAAADEQRAYLRRWQDELDRQLHWLALARRYLTGLLAGEPGAVHLQSRPPERIAWFTHVAPPGRFGPHFIAARDQLLAAGVTPGQAYFRWLADAGPGQVRGQIGFAVPAGVAASAVRGQVEERPASLNLTVRHVGPVEELPRTYAAVQELLGAHGWDALERPLERYPDLLGSDYIELLVPVLYLEGEEADD
jgi:DNA-binding transcriptional MerR regulator